MVAKESKTKKAVDTPKKEKTLKTKEEVPEAEPVTKQDKKKKQKKSEEVVVATEEKKDKKDKKKKAKKEEVKKEEPKVEAKVEAKEEKKEKKDKKKKDKKNKKAKEEEKVEEKSEEEKDEPMVEAEEKEEEETEQDNKRKRDDDEEEQDEEPTKVAKSDAAGAARPIVYVSRLSYSTQEESLKEFFSAVGEMTNLEWINDATNKFCGGAILTFADFDAVTKAAALTGQELDGRPINVDAHKEFPADCLTLFIGGLPRQLDEEEFKQLLAENNITPNSVRFPTDKMTGEYKGIAFCEFETSEQANAAYNSKIHSIGYMGRTLRVDPSAGGQSRGGDRPAFGGGDRGGRGGFGGRGGGGRGGFGDRGGRGGGGRGGRGGFGDRGGRGGFGGRGGGRGGFGDRGGRGGGFGGRGGRGGGFGGGKKTTFDE